VAVNNSFEEFEKDMRNRGRNGNHARSKTLASARHL